MMRRVVVSMIVGNRIVWVGVAAKFMFCTEHMANFVSTGHAGRADERPRHDQRVVRFTVRHHRYAWYFFRSIRISAGRQPCYALGRNPLRNHDYQVSLVLGSKLSYLRLGFEPLDLK